MQSSSSDVRTATTRLERFTNSNRATRRNTNTALLRRRRRPGAVQMWSAVEKRRAIRQRTAHGERLAGGSSYLSSAAGWRPTERLAESLTRLTINVYCYRGERSVTSWPRQHLRRDHMGLTRNGSDTRLLTPSVLVSDVGLLVGSCTIITWLHPLIILTNVTSRQNSKSDITFTIFKMN